MLNRWKLLYTHPLEGIVSLTCTCDKLIEKWDNARWICTSQSDADAFAYNRQTRLCTMAMSLKLTNANVTSYRQYLPSHWAMLRPQGVMYIHSVHVYRDTSIQVMEKIMNPANPPQMIQHKVRCIG